METFYSHSSRQHDTILIHEAYKSQANKEKVTLKLGADEGVLFHLQLLWIKLLLFLTHDFLQS